MSSAAGIAAVLFLLWVIYSLFFGRQLYSGGASSAGRDRETTQFGVRHTRTGDLWRGAIEGVVLLFAVATILDEGFDLLTAVLIGIAVAIVASLASLITGPGRLLVQVLYGFVGLVASATLLAALFADEGLCGGVDPALRTGVVVALLIVWVLSLLAGVLGGRLLSTAVGRYVSTWHASSGLALFGVVDVIVLAAGPVGLGIGATGVGIVFWGVAVIGLLTGFVPDLVMLVCALALALLSVVAAYTPVPVDCAGVGSSVPLAMMLGYCACLAVVSRLTLRRTRRGSW